MSKVLGSRTDYQIGVSYIPRGKGKKSASSSSTSRSSSQATPAGSRPMTAQEGSMLADLLFKIRDKMESGTLSFDETLHHPCYDILRTEVMSSQQPGGPSTQNPGSMPQQQQ